jgi:hypothetical protein
VKVEEVTGAAPDPNCLHCYLAPVIEKFCAEHPGKQKVALIVEAAQVLGELVGSSVFETETVDCLDRILTGINREVRSTALRLIAQLQLR